MITLSLLRHAKSAWDDPALDDYERGLAARGVKAAPAMGRFIAAEGLVPDLVLCSGAVRARATLALALSEWPKPPPEIRYDDALYLANPEAMLDILRRLDTARRHVMIVGHNPGLQALALELAGEGRRADMAALATKLPTAALAVITFEARGWKDVRPGTGRLERLVTAKGLRDEG